MKVALFDDTMTLLDLFSAGVARSGQRTALRQKLGGTWRDRTWADWHEAACEVAAGLCALGVEPGERIAILAQTCSRWVEADVGILMAAGVTVPVYPTLLSADVETILRDAGVRVVIADDPVVLAKLLRADADSRQGQDGQQNQGGQLFVAGVGHVVLLERVRRLDAPDVEGRVDIHVDDVLPRDLAGAVLPWSELRALGRKRRAARPRELDARREAVLPSSLASIVYTSGTTGEPRGVMLTHSNLVSESASVVRAVPLRDSDTQLLFLPLAHILAKLTIVLQMRVGFCTAFSPSMLAAMDDCLEVKPTFIVAVPRFYEKIQETVVRAAERSGWARQRGFTWALRVGRRVAELRRAHRRPRGLLSVEARYAQKFVFESIRARLGGRMRFMVSGAAPLDRGVAEFFFSAGLVVLEGYGLTETSGAATANTPGAFAFGTVGRAIPGVEVAVADDGEVLVRGPNVMGGYWGDAQSAPGNDGWLRTGDIGRLDEAGFLTITDRKKDLIVTAGGKNIAPVRVEAALESSPFIARAVVIGDKRTHLVALIEPDEPSVRGSAHASGSAGHWAELVREPTVRDLIAAEVDRANTRLASFERVKRFAVLDKPLDTAHGQLTSTLKLRRHVIAAQFAEIIESMYD